jgi:hypothetical protein
LSGSVSFNFALPIWVNYHRFFRTWIKACAENKSRWLTMVWPNTGPLSTW